MDTDFLFRLRELRGAAQQLKKIIESSYDDDDYEENDGEEYDGEWGELC